MKPARNRLTIRALSVFTLLFALDFAGIAWVSQNQQSHNVRVISMLGLKDDFWRVEQERMAWEIDPVREVTQPIVMVGAVLLMVAFIFWSVPRPLAEVLVIGMVVALAVG